MLLLAAVACGGAAATPVVVEKEVTKDVVVEKEVGKEVVTEKLIVATAVPAEAAPQGVTVHPGKLTIIMGDLANERLDDIYYPGAPGGLNYSRLMMRYLISDNEKREMVPGIASEWRISEDSLTWSFTVRQGVKWHDGSEVTPEDILWTLRHYWGPQANDYLAAPSRYSSAMEKIEITGPNEVSMFMTNVYIEMAISVSEATHSWKHMMPARATLGGDEEALAYDKNPSAPAP